MEQLRVMDGGSIDSWYDLDQMLAEIVAEYFPGVTIPVIRWGRKVTRKKRRSIRLGSYFRPTATIRIHPLLNSPEVPRYFVQSIVFHEMLHHVLGGSHNRRFHRAERRFRYHGEARAWLRANLLLLLGMRERPRRVLRVPPPAVAPPASQLSLFA
jgi:hypothetical protein